ERRIGPLRREAWLITEYCPGSNLFQRLGEAGDSVPDETTANAILHTFRQLNEARISHGDFKATNLLWHADQVWLIDLDAMQSHTGAPAWHKAWTRDRARFVRNWPADSELVRWLERVLRR